MIEQGLELAFEDGSYDELFKRHFGDKIAALALAERRVILLTNSSLPPLIDVDSNKYWYKL